MLARSVWTSRGSWYNARVRLNSPVALRSFRWGLVLLLALVVSASQTRVARADSDTEEPAPMATKPAPRLQLQDPGPSRAPMVSAQSTAADDSNQRPLWKNWVFWAITGTLVVAAVSVAIYTAPGNKATLSQCPPDVVVSLGCFGAGRGQ